jgi:hypothetical protein
MCDFNDCNAIIKVVIPPRPNYTKSPFFANEVLSQALLVGGKLHGYKIKCIRLTTPETKDTAGLWEACIK